MKNALCSVSLLLLLFFAACSSSDKKNSTRTTPQIKNGIYLLLNEFTDSTAKPTTGTIIRFSHDFLEPDDDQPGWLEIDTNAFVPLDLAKEPDSLQQEDKRIRLLLTLTDSAKVQLADFTEKYLNRHVAIVIGGRAVTKHKVKARIEEGKIQISRCTDNACKFLYFELKKKP